MDIKEVYNKTNGNIKSIIKYLQREDVKNSLFLETSTLNDDISISERLYCWINNIKKTPVCEYCGQPLKFYRINKGYHTTCGSKECKSKAIKNNNNKRIVDWTTAIKKRRETMFNTTGYTHQMFNDEYKNNFFKQYVENHNGEKCGFQSDISKAHNKTHIKKQNNPISFSIHKKITDLNTLKLKISDMGYEYISSYIDNDIEYITIKCNKCNNIFSLKRSTINRYYRNNKYSFCPKCDKIIDNTLIVGNWIESCGYTIIYNKTVYKNKKTYTFDMYIVESNIYIDIINKVSESKREMVKEYKLYYLELFSYIDKEDVYKQIERLLFFIDSSYNMYTDDNLQKEYNYYYKMRTFDDNELMHVPPHLNHIIKTYQFKEFYKYEIEMYLYDCVHRRKVIDNCIKYLQKDEKELEITDILTGFKKSGTYYGYSHFNPRLCNWFVNKYSINSIYDPCGGWGHHLLGMLQCNKIIYNDFNESVCENIKRMKFDFQIEQLDIHCNDARFYKPDEYVDAWFMCPPYNNVETYNEKRFKSIYDYQEFLNSIFDIWNSSSAKYFCLVLREDFIKLINYTPSEVYNINVGISPLVKTRKHKKQEKIYIFKKNEKFT